MNDVTPVLKQLEAGDPNAASHLMPLVYEEVRKLATARLASERPDHTLQSTAVLDMDGNLNWFNSEESASRFDRQSAARMQFSMIRAESPGAFTTMRSRVRS